MGTAMFHTPIKTILLVIIYSSKKKTEKVDAFAVIFTIIIITSTSDLQPSTAIANQLPDH